MRWRTISSRMVSVRKVSMTMVPPTRRIGMNHLWLAIWNSGVIASVMAEGSSYSHPPGPLDRRGNQTTVRVNNTFGSAGRAGRVVDRRGCVGLHARRGDVEAGLRCCHDRVRVAPCDTDLGQHGGELLLRDDPQRRGVPDLIANLRGVNRVFRGTATRPAPGWRGTRSGSARCCPAAAPHAGLADTPHSPAR